MAASVVAKAPNIRFIGPVIGRYLLESRVRLPGVQVFACRLQSISPFQMVVSAPVVGCIAEGITANFEPFGTLRGAVTREIDGGFAAEIVGDDDDREKLALRIEWYKKRTFAGLTDKRQHRRFMPREPRSAIVLGRGLVLPCLVIDMSASGVAVSADYEPALGEPLAVGRMVGRVVRRLDVGFAVQFIEAEEIEVVEELLRTPEEWERATSALAQQDDYEEQRRYG
jgi:hypothetical protein